MEVVGLAGLDPDRADEHEMIQPLRHLGRGLGGAPAADGEADEIGSRQTETVEQIEIDVADVVHAVEPVRQRRSSKAGMRGGNDAPLLRKQVEKGQIRHEAAAAMQIKD